MSETVGTNVTVHVWYDEQQNVIKLRIKGQLTSVWPDPASKRGNPSLFKMLAAVLRDEGKRHPAVE